MSCGKSETPKKGDPLTLCELTEASDIFFPLFEYVHGRMPKGTDVEDTLKVMETVAKLGHKRRAEKIQEEAKLKFGFNKNDSDS